MLPLSDVTFSSSAQMNQSQSSQLRVEKWANGCKFSLTDETTGQPSIMKSQHVFKSTINVAPASSSPSVFTQSLCISTVWTTLCSCLHLLHLTFIGNIASLFTELLAIPLSKSSWKYKSIHLSKVTCILFSL